jgi:8-oxo-dGTP pyrophosphatase MutT (NUDIX family)
MSDWHLIRGVVDEEPEIRGDLAAVLVPLYELKGDLVTVLTKRPMHMPTHKGDLAFPGGKYQEGDGGPVGTALREANEEVGISPEAVEVLGYLPAIHTVEFDKMVIPVVGRLSVPPSLVPDPNEVDKILLPTIRDLADDSTWYAREWNGKRNIWFRNVEDEVLWGATAMMTRRLLGLGEEG